MDGLIYTIMSGANRTWHTQQIRANNIANVGTTGFRADIEMASSHVVPGAGFDSRSMIVPQPTAINVREGSLVETGSELDVAIQGEGFFVVATEQGEAYTRAGNFIVDTEGSLTVNGYPVMGENGPIVLPAFAKIAIATDGVISLQEKGESHDGAMHPVDRLKRVKPAPHALSKEPHGLLVSRLGERFSPDSSVTVLHRHLENSNVSAVEEMIGTMTLNRDFEIQMKMFNVASDMVDAGNRVIRG